MDNDLIDGLKARLHCLKEQIETLTSQIDELTAEIKPLAAEASNTSRAIAILEGAKKPPVKQKRGYFWTAERLAQTASLISQGITYKEIAERLGTTEKAVQQQAWIHRFGKHNAA